VGPHRRHRPATERSAFGGEAAALGIGQLEAAACQLPLEDPVFLHQVFNDVLLVAIDPTGEGHQQHLQGGEVGNHSPILPCATMDRQGCTSAEYADSTGSYGQAAANAAWWALRVALRADRGCTD